MNKKIGSLLGVSASNIITFLVNIIVHFILPVVLSVESYSYWQLHTLYAGYCCFALLGLNDGVHLKYSNLEYNDKSFLIFAKIRKASIALSLLFTVLTLGSIPLFSDHYEKIIVAIVAMEILPSCLNSLFSYINQGTMKFKEYSIGNAIESIFILASVAVLMAIRCDNIIVYLIFSMISKYIRLGYYIIVNKEIFSVKIALLDFSFKEMATLCGLGIVLTIAVTLYGSLLLFAKIFVKDLLSLADYGSFSFAINILTALNTLVLAISQVFFPILKRASGEAYGRLMKLLDRTLSILNVCALLSYFVVYFLIILVYPKYSSVLTYLNIIYPIFLFLSKGNIIVINEFKTKDKNIAFAIISFACVVYNAASTYLLLKIYASILLVAINSLITYILFYVISVMYLKKFVDNMTPFNFNDVITIVAFELITNAYRIFNIDNNTSVLLISGCMYILFGVCYCILNRKDIFAIYRGLHE